MPTLENIQRLVDEAWEADSESTQEDLISTIITTLSQCTDLDQKSRTALANLIPKLLDDKTLEATPTPINVKGLVKWLRAGIVTVPARPGPWPPR